ncbi:MAG: glutathione S-transferase family protein [Wenzhouxiangellaceae bacterium]
MHSEASSAAAVDERPLVYGTSYSGNCYKVALTLRQSGQPFRWREIDILRNETRQEDFLALNANGKVPTVHWPDGRVLAESNAIMVYLASGSDLWPQAPWAQAQALQWLFFEQYSHEPYIAVARFIQRCLPEDHPRQQTLPELRQRGVQALAVMEQQLHKQDWFTGDAYGIADIALYAYTAVAEEGGYDLTPYPAIHQWLQRVSASRDFLPMQGSLADFSQPAAGPTQE